jgi:hypothetical protein
MHNGGEDMARLRNFWRRLTGWLTGRWAKNKKPLLVVLLIVIAVVLYRLVEAGYAYPWTGFGEYTPPQPKIEGYQRERTTWDWLQLLIIPFVLAVGGFFLNRTERVNAEKAAEQRAKTEREIAEQRAQDAALQAYLDQMTQLLLHEYLRTSQPDNEVRSVARARTLAVLRVLDGVRKATVLQFLYEAGLIGDSKQEEYSVPGRIDAIVSLQGANLKGANLKGAYLRGAYLERVNLEGANLYKADLYKANLLTANLKGAYLREAFLAGACLIWAHLVGADLDSAGLNEASLGGANLTEANLERARLENANLTKANLTKANLTKANLTHCKVTREQLAQASSLKGAKLPFDMAPPAPEVKVSPPNEQPPDLSEAALQDGTKHE